MISLRVSGLLLAFSCACQAAEIVAWKNGLAEHVRENLKENEAVKLASPPESSVFFDQGDELWDVSKAFHFRKIPKSEWLVWNATSQRLVMKGSPAEIGMFQQRMTPDAAPTKIRILAEVFQTADGKPVAEGATPAFSFSMNTRSGMELERGLETPEWQVHWKGTATVSDRFPVLDLSCELKLQPKGQPDLSVKTSMTADAGKPMWLASDDDGKTGIHVRVTPMIERLDGVPREEVTMIQRGNERKSVVEDRETIEPVTLPEGGVFLSMCDFGRALGFTQEEGGDPFAQNTASDPVVPAYKETVVPDHLAKLVDGPLLDIRPFFRELGPDLTDKDFAGYNPLRDRIYVHIADTADSMKFDMMRVLLEPGLSPVRGPAVMGFTLEGPRRCYLVTSSGSKQSLERHSGDGQIVFFETEPTMGGDSDRVDLRLEYRQAGETGRKRIVTSLMLEPDKPAVIVERISDSDPGLRVTGKTLKD